MKYIKFIFFISMFYPGIMHGSECELYTQKTFTYKTTAAGHNLKLDVYRSAQIFPSPIIFYIHGGALIFGARSDIPLPFLELYLRHGFTVVVIDYRLAPESKLAEITEDVVDAYEWLGANGKKINGDLERVSVVGHSAGGYLALYLSAVVKKKPSCVVSYYGYGQLNAPWYSEPDELYQKYDYVSHEVGPNLIQTSKEISRAPNDSSYKRVMYYLYVRQYGYWPEKISGYPSENEDYFSAFEPVHLIDKNYPPTMLLHGERDADVPFSEARLLTEVLTANNVENYLIHKKKWKHAFDKNFYYPDVQRAIMKSIKFLKDKNTSYKYPNLLAMPNKIKCYYGYEL